MEAAESLREPGLRDARDAPRGPIAQTLEILRLTPVTTLIWLAMIAVAAGIVALLDLSWLWLPPIAYAVLALHELCAFALFHRGLFPSAERVARAYQWFALFLGDSPDLKRRGDLTEGLFEGDFTKTIEQATLDKYQRIVALLGLERGHRVLDIGCGLGEFLSYLKAQGIAGTGFTLSPEQQRIAERRGLDVRLADFRRPLPPDLVGAFDAVTLVGSLEHFNTSYQMADRARADAVFAEVFRSSALAIDRASRVGRVFSATLHSTAPADWSASDWIHAYSFHGHYSGLYPLAGDFERLCAPWFAVEHRQDMTIDYHYSSLVGGGHFGKFEVEWTAVRLAAALLTLLVNPFAPWSWIYHWRSSWLWQFGGTDIRTTRTRPARALWYVHGYAASAELLPQDWRAEAR